MTGSDFIFCAIGTTMKKVNGDIILYRTIDFDIPVDPSNFSQDNHTTFFGLVSSVGANSKSKNFYLNLKGQVKEAIKKTSIPSISIFRLSM